MPPQETYPGAHPYLQGYWASVWGFERKSPDKYPGQQTVEFQREWLRGWDEYHRRIMMDGEAIGGGSSNIGAGSGD